MTAYAVKVVLSGPADSYVLQGQRTMHGGRSVAVDDVVFVFDSAAERGLTARAKVTSVTLDPRLAGVARQVPKVSLTLRCEARAQKRLGRAEVRGFANWQDGRPETEINFKVYRQATAKLVGLSDATAVFLAGFF